MDETTKAELEKLVAEIKAKQAAELEAQKQAIRQEAQGELIAHLKSLFNL